MPMNVNMEKGRRKLTEAKKALIVKQDLRLVKLLAGNNPRLSQRAIKSLRKWIDRRAKQMSLTEEDYMRVWKGLFYAMWMSDKPLIQEECAENIANLLHMENVQCSLQFFKYGLTTLCNEWFGIDQLRLNKFLMFTRRFLRQGLCVLKKNKWNLQFVRTFNASLSTTVLNNDANQGLTLHFIEIFLEELAKVSEGAIRNKVIVSLLDPFANFLATAKDKRQRTHLVKHIFHYLMQQSDTGMDFEERFEVWKREGFPGGTIETIKKVKVSQPKGDEEEEEVAEKVTILDPRAGYVDVELPQLRFEAKTIANLLKKHRFDAESTTDSRRTILSLIKEFESLQNKDYPLGIKEITVTKGDNYETRINDAVNRLEQFEDEQLYADNRKRKRKMMENNEIESLPKKKKKVNVSKGKRTLEDFIEESESNIRLSPHKSDENTKRKNETNVKSTRRSVSKRQSTVNATPKGDDWVVESNFKRNSGTWVVSREKDNVENDVSVEKTPEVSSEKRTSKTSVSTTIRRITPTKVVEKEEKSEATGNGWDEPLQNGETEFFVESKKYKKKMQRTRSTSISPIATTPRRFSLDSNLVKNPFSKKSRPSLKFNSEKKVKIDLKLNQSQEMHDFLEQIRNSPGIPFDGSKKPLKSLLKPNFISGPINPFYKRKLRFS